MQIDKSRRGRDLVGTSTRIVGAFVGGNHIPAAELPALIRTVHTILAELAGRGMRSGPAEAVEPATPAQIRRSITPDALISFIDGGSYKTLKRHLSSYGLDPHRYRQRYGLPEDYPMVAASYAMKRSEIAKAIGLGRPATSA